MGLDYIDPNRTISNDIVEIFDVLGMEAARQSIYNELRNNEPVHQYREWNASSRVSFQYVFIE